MMEQLIRKIFTEDGTGHTSIFTVQDTTDKEKDLQKQYQIEAVYVDGSYSGSVTKKCDLSSALEELFIGRSSRMVLAKGLITPVVDGVKTNFQLLNGIRI